MKNLYILTILLFVFFNSSGQTVADYNLLIVDGYGSNNAKIELESLGHSVTIETSINLTTGYDYSSYNTIIFMYDSDEPSGISEILSLNTNNQLGIILLRGQSLINSCDMGSSVTWSDTDFTIEDNSHFITQPFSIGTLDLGFTYKTNLTTINSGNTILGSVSSGNGSLVVNNNYRRVLSPYYGHSAGMPWSSDAGVLMDRIIAWTAFSSDPVDADNDGYTDDIDCDDTNAAINPGATEIFDGIDNDCDGLIDCDDPSYIDNEGPVFNLGGDGTQSKPFTSLLTEIVGIVPSGTYYFNFNGNTFQGELDNDNAGGGWLMILNYVHKAGDNSNLIVRNTDLPLLGASTLGSSEANSSTWGHFGNALAADIDFEEMRFYGQTSRDETNVIDFTTNYINAVNYIKTGSGSFNGIHNPTNYTLLGDHAATIPQNAQQYFLDKGNFALTNFPFWTVGQAHWGIRGLGNRWEVDDFTYNSYNTIHRVWVRGDLSSVAQSTTLTVQLDAAGNATVGASDFGLTVIDNCSTSTLSLSQTSFTCADTGNNTIQLTAIDAVGNSTIIDVIVIIEDNIDPTIECIATDDVYTDLGLCTANITLTPPTVSDNCTIEEAALDFDGSNDYISFTNDLSAVTNFTYEAWVNVRNQGRWSRILDFGIAPGRNIFFTSSIGDTRRPRFAINIGSGEQLVTSNTLLPLNTWTHLAVTLDDSSNTATMYMDGEVVATNTNFIYSPSSLGSTSNNWIGRSQYADTYFNGQLDEIRFWNVTRTQAEIVASMNATLSGTEAGLIAYYNLNEGLPSGNNTSLNSVSDISGNTNTGTLNNFTKTGTGSNWVNSLFPSSNVSLTNDYNNTSDASGVYPVGTTTVIWTATDAAGNSSTCTQNITVTDNEDPTISCPSDIDVIATSENGAEVTYTAPTGTDNCPNSNTVRTAGPASGSTFPIGTTTVTYTVTDAANNTADCSFTVTVTGVAPQIVCPADISQNNDANKCGANVSFAATETAGIPASTITYSHISGSEFPVGTTTVTATATNAVGSTDCTFTITVNDTEDPTIACAADVSINNTPGECYGEVVLTEPSVLDNCASIGNALDFDRNGRITISNLNISPSVHAALTAEAWINLSSSSGIQTVVGNDNGGYDRGIVIWNGTYHIFAGRDINTGIAPVLNQWQHVAVSWTSSEIKFYLNGQEAYTTSGETNDPGPSYTYISGPYRVDGAIDELRVWNEARTLAQIQANLDNEIDSDTNLLASYHFNQGVANGNNAGLTTATDATGNGNNGTLNDFALNGSTSNWVDGKTFGPTLTNDAPATFDIGDTTVTWTATDAAGNTATCEQIVTVTDNEDPVITCPSNIEVFATSAAGAVVTYAAPTGTDNCPNATTALVTTGFPSGATFPIGATTVTYEVTDASNNTADCSFTVTVTGVAPQIVCPADISQNNDANKCGANVSFAATETAGIPASTITYSHVSGSEFPVGTTTVTATATNAVGSSECTFTVTVNDTEGPTAIAQDLTVYLDENGQASIAVDDIDNGSFDNCGTISTSIDITNFDCSDVNSVSGNHMHGLLSGGSAEVISVTGYNGATNYRTTLGTTCTESWYPRGTLCDESPNTDDPDLNTRVNTNAGATWSNISPNSSYGSLLVDLGSKYSINKASVFQMFSDGKTTHIEGWYHPDSGAIPPADNDPGWTQLFPYTYVGSGTKIGNTVSDPLALNFTTAQTRYVKFHAKNDASLGSPNWIEIRSIKLFGPVNEVILTVTDDNGNSSTATATVTVEDNVTPTITVAASDLTVECDGSGNTAQLQTWLDNHGGTGVASDACGIEWTHNFTTLSDDCGETGLATVTFTATDPSNNSVSTTATFKIEDTTDPTIDVQASDLTVECDGAGNTAQVNAWLASIGNTGAASDVCGGVVWTDDYTGLSDECGATGSALVTFTATDDCGNTSTTQATFTIEDTTAPTIDVQASDLTVECDGAGNTAQLNAWLASYGTTGAASDVCGGVVWTNNYTSLSDECGATGSALVTFTATDDCGNTSTTQATFTIEDTTAPVLTVPADVTINCEDDTSSAINGVATATDICSNFTITESDVSTQVMDNLDLGYYNYTITRTWTVVDECSNTSTFDQIITVQDVTPPVVDCNTIEVILNANGDGSITAEQLNNSSSDNCSAELFFSISEADEDFDCGDIGGDLNDLIISEYVDGANFENYIELYNGTGLTVDLSEYKLLVYYDGSATPTKYQLGGTVADRQPIVISHPGAQGFPFANNTPLITFNGDDAIALEHNGTIIDLLPVYNSTISLVGTTLIRKDTVNNGNVSSATGADGWTQVNGAPIVDLLLHDIIFKDNDHNVLLTVTDISGNISTCIASVTVIDNINPTAIAQDVTVQLDANGNGSTTADAVDDGSFDNCDIASLVLSKTAFTCEDIATNPNQVTLTVTDVNGNVSTTTAYVTVEDNVAPIAIAQDVIVQLDVNGVGSTTAALVNNNSTDACGIQSLSLSQTDFDCSHVGLNVVTLTVTDVNGNVSDPVTANVDVQDNVDPVALCKPVTVTLDENGNASITTDDIDDGSNDACGIASLSLDITSFDCDDVDNPVTVELTVTDNNNNVSTCTAIVTVIGDIPTVSINDPEELPEFCQGAVLVLTTTATYADTYLWSTGETTESIEVGPAGGTFTVTVTSGTNCTATDTFTVAPFDESELLSSYTILAEDEVFLHGSNIVQTGGVGVTSNSGLIKLHQASNIIGFGRAVNFTLNQGSTIGTQIPLTANIPYPAFVPNNLSNAGSPDATINNNQSVTLNGSVYDEIVVKQGATVTFSQPNVYINDLKTFDGASIEFTQCTNVYINEKFMLAQNGKINKLSGQNVVIYVNEDVQIEKGSYVRARLHSNGNELLAKGANANGNKAPEPTEMIGLFICKKVHGSTNVVWNADPLCESCPPATQTAANTDTEKGHSKFEINSWPNPSDTEFNVKISSENTKDMISISVFDMSNKLVHSDTFSPDDVHKFGDKLEAGVYIVKVTQGHNIKTVRLVRY